MVIERGSDVGGTWRDNTYPGAACDVPSQLYSFSFARNPDWSSSYSPQPEIQAYLKKVAERSGTLDRFVFDTSVAGRGLGRRRAALDGHDLHGHPADDLVRAHPDLGAGGLSEPKMPEIDGLDTFQGELFHSAQWDHDTDLTGKRVAVIGTGASAIQIVPELQKVVGHLDVYQRTAPWVIPRNDRTYGDLEKKALRWVPGLQRAYRTGVYWAKEVTVPSFTLWPKISKPAQTAAIKNLKKGIKDPELREKVTPHFTFGCKRVLISNDYYPALAADNVDVVTDPIVKVTGSAHRHRRRHRARDRRARRGDRLLHHRAPHRRSTSSASTASPSPTSGATPAWRRTRARPSRTSRTSSWSWARTWASATRAWCS